MNILKQLAVTCALAASVAPMTASAADVFSCTKQLVPRPDRQSCNGANAVWVASAGALRVTTDVFSMDTSEVTSVTTQGYDGDRLAIGGCVSFRQSPGSNTSPTCSRTVFFHETTQVGG